MNIVMLTGNIMLANRLTVHYDRPSTFINIIIVPRVQNGFENSIGKYSKNSFQSDNIIFCHNLAVLPLPSLKGCIKTNS